jgi:hypothetical protein
MACIRLGFSAKVRNLFQEKLTTYCYTGAPLWHSEHRARNAIECDWSHLQVEKMVSTLMQIAAVVSS